MPPTVRRGPRVLPTLALALIGPMDGTTAAGRTAKQSRTTEPRGGL
jgi:hypothetical protein